MAAQPDGLTKLISAINLKNSTTYTAAQLVISPPQVNTDPNVAANTSVTVVPTSQTNCNGSSVINYNRRDLGQWAWFAANQQEIVVSVTGISMVSELLVLLNNQFNSGFTLQDFAEGLLPVGSYPLTFALDALPSSYAYTGSLIITLSNNVVPISSVLTNTNLGDIDSPSSSTCSSGVTFSTSSGYPGNPGPDEYNGLYGQPDTSCDAPAY